ncbi:aldo/keto reductase [bacterium]|nr:MAG: aldo/keto reductase [bacterium]
MERRLLGKTGLQVSALGFGGSEIRDADQHTVDYLLNAALDAGLNTLDTAECYGDSEEKIGKSVSTRRGDFHLFTKCGHDGEALGGSDWDPATLMKSIDRSLERLQVDHVDLVQLHTCSKEQLEQGDVIEVLQRAKEAGKTRFIGYSGDNEAATYAVACGAFDTLQTSVNIADQGCIDGWVADAKAAHMGVIAKRPIANAAWRPAAENDGYARVYRDRLSVLDFPFLKDEMHDIETALRFTLTVPGVSTLIVGTNKPDRWKGNAALASGGALTVEEYESIRKLWHEIAGEDWRAQG